MKKYLFVIPARLKSKRLPEKPLINIKGLPMIIRTYNQCQKIIPSKNIVIATDSKKIIEVCKKYKAPFILTSKKCLTGTDRVAEVAKKIKSKIYINLQGDEPIFPSMDIKKFLKNALSNSDKILNGFCKMKNNEDFKNVNIPKVLVDQNNNLIYMSRSSIPGNKKNKLIKAWRQVCIYSYPRSLLLKFSSESKTPIEKIEDIEILRFLEYGFKIKMIMLSDRSIAVDNKDDLKKILKKVLK